MQQVLIKLILDLISKAVTPEVVKKAEVELVAYLRAKAAATPSDLDDKVVDIIAKALGV